MTAGNDVDEDGGIKGMVRTEDAFQNPVEGERLTCATAPDENLESMEETHDLRMSYERIAEEYAGRLYDELDHKPLDRALLEWFVEKIRG